jgi:hypothetical protein
MSMFRGTLGTMTDEIETISQDAYSVHAEAEERQDQTRLRDLPPSADPQQIADELRAAKMPCMDAGEQTYDENGYPIS